MRLLSPLYRTTWLPRRELVAGCHRGLEWGRLPSRAGHTPPDLECGCGIYGGKTPERAASYMSGFFKARADVLHRVIGTVSLWGTVIECELGWRASHAYPERIYVPVPVGSRFSFLRGGLRHPALPAEEIARALAEYGVPVALVECATLRELAGTLGSEGGALSLAA